MCLSSVSSSRVQRVEFWLIIMCSSCSSVAVVLVAQSCPTLCSTLGYSLLSSPVRGILQARILEWAAIPSPGDLPDAGIKPRSPAFRADSLLSELSGMPHHVV